MRTASLFLLVALAALGIGRATPGRAADLPAGFTDELVADSLRFIAGIAFLPDGRLLVTESKIGRLLVVAAGSVGHVGLPDSVDGATEEEGLLGVAVDPGWPARPYVYLFHDALDQYVWIVRYNVTGDLSDPSSANLALAPGSRHTILRDIPDIRPNHNGGTLRFGPDGMLWAGLAEDANACTAQDLVSLRGVIVRMDVSALPDGGGGPADKLAIAPPDNPYPLHPNPNARLVWAIGLRNPFRFHIDPADGALYVGDVGFEAREEISVCDEPGMNFGWPFYEGSTPLYLTECGFGPPPGLAFPIHEYVNPIETLASVIAGPVYRSPGGACAFPAEYEGDYFYTDHYDGVIRRLKKTLGVWDFADSVNGQPSATDWARDVSRVADFAIGPDGALWYARYGANFQDSTGQIRRICYTPPSGGVSEPGAGVAFDPPWPSPARGAVHLSYTLPRASRVVLAIHDVAGRLVRRLVAEAVEPAGRRQVTWDGATDAGRRVPAGLYMARLVVDGASIRRPVAIVR